MQAPLRHSQVGAAATMQGEKESKTHLVLHPGRKARQALAALLRGGALLANSVGGGLHHLLYLGFAALQKGAV